VTAQFVAAKATRDALFLTALHVSALPMMLVATAACSILFTTAYARVSRSIAPAFLVPASFIVSGVLFVCEWAFRPVSPAAGAVVIYLHISGAGPLLASGFWLIASERFDPRSAKTRFGQIAGAGTLGGIVGGLLCERVAACFGVPAMLLVLAAFQFVAAWLVRRLAVGLGNVPSADALPGVSRRATIASKRSGLRVIAGAPQLQYLAAVVFLGTTSAALVDYLFQAQAVGTFGPGDRLLRFFALYYAVTSLVSFGLQTLASRAVLERFGVALTTSTPSIALLAGSIGGLIAPGFGSLMVARGGESVLRASWFRAGYELFYTPIPAADKRAAKSLIDVAFDRLGDATGGGVVRLVLIFVPAAIGTPVILALAMTASIGAIVAASQLNRWYVRSLEKSLVKRAGGVMRSREEESLAASALATLCCGGNATATLVTDGTARYGRTLAPALIDPLAEQVRALRSGDRRRILDVLSRPEGLAPALVPHAIALLASDSFADAVSPALRQVAEKNVAALADALLDRDHDQKIRRRVARVLSVCSGQAAADALLRALSDPRFRVRNQAARSLAAIQERNPLVRIDRDRIYDIVLEEAAVGRPVWEGRRMLENAAAEEPAPKSPLDEFVRHRASQSLAHVFTLLSLVLPKEPLGLAFKSLHSADRQLRGTALEYLEGTLPAPIRHQLWPYLVDEPVRRKPVRDEILADLLRSNCSITLQGLAAGLDQARLAGLGTA